MKGEYQHIHREIIEAASLGDPQAQERLYKLYARAMYNICRRILGDEEEARDILQESFTDVFLKLPTLREKNTFSFWIKRIVTNNCINVIRKRKMMMEELSETHDAVEEERDDMDYTQIQAARIMEEIDHLPDGCRTVLSLYLFEGYDHKEIAQILSISESASKAQYCKAKARIRQQIDLRSQQYV